MHDRIVAPEDGARGDIAGRHLRLRARVRRDGRQSLLCAAADRADRTRTAHGAGRRRADRDADAARLWRRPAVGRAARRPAREPAADPRDTGDDRRWRWSRSRWRRAAATFLVAAMVVGFTSAGRQMVVPFAASLAPEETRGRTIGNVMSGLLAGIMLSRPAASLIAEIGRLARGVRRVGRRLCCVLAPVAGTRAARATADERARAMALSCDRWRIAAAASGRSSGARSIRGSCSRSSRSSGPRCRSS